MAQTTPKLPEALDAIRGILPADVSAMLDRLFELRAARRASVVTGNRFKAGPQRPQATGDPAVDGPAAEQHRADRHAYQKAMHTNSAMTSVARGRLYQWARSEGQAFVKGSLGQAIGVLVAGAKPFIAQITKTGLDPKDGAAIAERGTQDQVRAFRKIADLDREYQPFATAAREVLKEVHGSNFAARRQAMIDVPATLVDAAAKFGPITEAAGLDAAVAHLRAS
ncbi:hypothetical protein [Phytohabitans kaempferiae]|uniref:Uncharacterized protein n=1 Tax=Phytohabitans kaempferiae TaxID=1620943 RepID=A0ABV6M037_9ACTN